MPVKLENTEKAARLFGGWQEAILWSCLDKVMGTVYANETENPVSAMAVLGDFCFLAGKPDKSLAEFEPGNSRRDCMIMIPQNAGWSGLITECYGGKAKPVKRYAFKKEKDAFDADKLRSAVKSAGPEYTLKRIDDALFDCCKANDWSRDLVSQFGNYEIYRSLGIGMAVLKEGELVAGASSYARYKEGIEIEIDTKEEYRRKGLAYACGAALILECMERGLYPSWDAQNERSAALAEKLGYRFAYEYPAYEVVGCV